MALGLIVGVTLVMAGLVLLCHLSYTELSEKHRDVDPEDPTSGPTTKHNDCLLPMCFFQFSRVRNHESWIVACLLSGAAVLLLSMV
jgi:hypothetical protein